METVKALIIILKSVPSYLYKHRPYMTCWIGCGIFVSIKERDIGIFIACMISVAFLIVIKRGLLMISRIGGDYNPGDEKLLGPPEKGRFFTHVKEYCRKKYSID